jgi:hypothetical protein
VLGLACATVVLTATAAPPTGLSVASIQAGALVFAAEFPTCLREDGSLEPPDAVLANAVWDGRAGDLARWLKADFGGAALPGLADRLAPPARAALVDFLRAHMAGREMAAWGRWLHPLPAPEVELHCGDEPRPLAAWRGQGVRLSAVDGRLGLGSCSVATPGAWNTYAVIAGLPPDLLSGTTFVIDAEGMLAARELPGPGMAPGPVASIRAHRH